VTHACNPSYSGGRDQEDRGLKPAPNKHFCKTLFEKVHHRKRTGRVAQGEKRTKLPIVLPSKDNSCWHSSVCSSRLFPLQIYLYVFANTKMRFWSQVRRHVPIILALRRQGRIVILGPTWATQGDFVSKKKKRLSCKWYCNLLYGYKPIWISKISFYKFALYEITKIQLFWPMKRETIYASTQYNFLKMATEFTVLWTVE
jgi:hypothetical protein